MSPLERLYDAHAHAMFAFALDLTRSEADTRDILQSIFCRLAEKPTILRGVRDERAFLLRMVYTRIVDASRRRNRGQTFHYEPPGDHFRLWSNGWNQIDDGGRNERNASDGDWVWARGSESQVSSTADREKPRGNLRSICISS